MIATSSNNRWQSLALATVLKLNDDELPIVARMFGIAGEPRRQMSQLADQFALRAVAVTRGSSGAVLMRGGQFREQPGIGVTVRDTVGAGDSFTAALSLGLLRGEDLDQINRRAGRIAAYVCTQPGATPVLRDELSGMQRRADEADQRGSAVRMRSSGSRRSSGDR
jgi:fructokinase